MNMNEMQQILKRLKFLSNKNTDFIAKQLGFKSRPYFNNQVNKGVNEEIKNKMLAYEEKLKQSVSSGQPDFLIQDGEKTYIADAKATTREGVDYTKEYIDLLKKQIEKDKTELDKVNERLDNMEANLSGLLKKLTAVDTKLEEFAEEILTHLLPDDQARRAAKTSVNKRVNDRLFAMRKERTASEKSS